MLNSGVHPKTPLHIQTGHSVPAAEDFVYQKWKHVRDAKEFLQSARSRQKAYADKKRREATFEPGD